MEEIERYCIDGKTYKIILTYSDNFLILIKNETEGWRPASHLCAGSSYETESGAAWAILNEYRVQGE